MSWLLPKNRGARMIDNVNQRIAALQPYKPGKPIEELARELGINDIVKLASNENPLGPSQAVLDAVVEASAQLPRYPDGSGFELKQSLAEHLRVDTAQITLGNGSNDVLDLIARVALQPGSEAIIAEHSFVVYRLAVTCCGGDLVTVPAKDYGADLDAMLAAVTERTRVVFLANPNNPTGTWVAAAAIENFLQQLRPDLRKKFAEHHSMMLGELSQSSTLKDTNLEEPNVKAALSMPLMFADILLLEALHVTNSTS